MHIHVIMLCFEFELIPIKIGFFINFKSYFILIEACFMGKPDTDTVYKHMDICTHTVYGVMYTYSVWSYVHIQ